MALHYLICRRYIQKLLISKILNNKTASCHLAHLLDNLYNVASPWLVVVHVLKI